MLIYYLQINLFNIIFYCILQVPRVIRLVPREINGGFTVHSRFRFVQWLFRVGRRQKTASTICTMRKRLERPIISKAKHGNCCEHMVSLEICGNLTDAILAFSSSWWSEIQLLSASVFPDPIEVGLETKAAVLYCQFNCSNLHHHIDLLIWLFYVSAAY